MFVERHLEVSPERQVRVLCYHHASGLPYHVYRSRETSIPLNLLLANYHRQSADHRPTTGVFDEIH